MQDQTDLLADQIGGVASVYQVRVRGRVEFMHLLESEVIVFGVFHLVKEGLEGVSGVLNYDAGK